MIPEYIRGSIAPVFTAFHADGTLDDDGQRHFLDYLVDAGGVHAYFIRCGLGQMYSFTCDDVKQIARTVCRHMAGAGPSGNGAAKGPVMIGTAGEWDRDYAKRPDPDIYVRQGIELGQYAEDHGADAVVYTMPEALVPKDGQTHAELVLSYFETLSEALRGPIFIYQSPGTQEEYLVDVDLVRRLADLPKVMGMKASTNDAEYILNITWALRGKDYAFISGAETAFLAGLVSGARAVIGQGATVNPKVLNAIQDRFEAGDFAGAVEAQRSTNFLCEVCPSPTGFMKRYVAEKGYAVQPHARGAGATAYGAGRPPLTDDEYEAYKRIYEEETAKYE